MRQRFIVVFTVLAMTSLAGIPRLSAQGSIPQAYSFTADPGFALFGPNVVRVSRDGSKEAVDQTMAPGPGHDKEYHSHRLYDFQAHKLYIRVLSDSSGACGVQDITESTAPPELDPIGGAAALLEELRGTGQLKEVGTETINGIATRIMDANSAEGNGKIWIAQNGGFPVKVVATGPDGKAQTIIEVKQLSLARPPASAFALPEGCESVQAETPAKPGVNVTALTLQPIPDYKGPCPAHLTMTGTITTDGPGTVFYQFGAGKFDPAKPSRSARRVPGRSAT